MTTAHLQMDTWYELMRNCPARPFTSDGELLTDVEELSPGRRLKIVEERDGQLVVTSEGTAPAAQWRYLVEREALQTAVTVPEGLPREGQAPKASANTAGSPD